LAYSHDTKRWEFYSNLRNDCRGKSRIFDAAMRRDYHCYNIYTSDTGLLDYMLYNMDLAAITHIRYTSEAYDTEIAKLEGVPFDIVFKRTVNPRHLYKCWISSASSGDGLSNLGGYIERNPEHFTIEKYLLRRMTETGRIWASDYYFYCDDLDVLTLAVVAGGNSIRKIYKSVQKEEQQ
jgi:hypothetical protein